MKGYKLLRTVALIAIITTIFFTTLTPQRCTMTTRNRDYINHSLCANIRAATKCDFGATITISEQKEGATHKRDIGLTWVMNLAISSKLLSSKQKPRP